MDCMSNSMLSKQHVNKTLSPEVEAQRLISTVILQNVKMSDLLNNYTRLSRLQFVFSTIGDKWSLRQS